MNARARRTVQELPLLSVAVIGRECAKIGAEAVGDSGLAHKHERELHESVLRAIAAGVPNASELARAALHTCGLDFDRRY